MLLKATTVTNLTDARYYAAKEVDYLGFNLEEGTEGYLDPMYMKAIREWVAGPQIVGEFSQMPGTHVAAAAEFLNLDVVQLSAKKHLADLSLFSGLDIILHIDARQEPGIIEEIFRTAAPHITCFLLDFSESTNWEFVLYQDTAIWNECFELRPTMLQANFSPAQLPMLFKKLNLAGLSLLGAEEEQVGVKSFDEIEEIFEAIEGLF